MTKDKALKLALEALQYVYEGANNQGPHTGISWRCASNKVEPVIAAIDEALAEQPAQQHIEHCLWARNGHTPCPHVQPAQHQDSETIVQTFTGLPKRKLRDLLAAGWQINGVCFQRTEENGTVRRGAATTGGTVLWWNQPAQQQEPVAWMFQHEETGRTMCVDAQQVEWGFEKGNPRLKKIAPLYTSPPASKPLTDEQIMEMYNEPRSDAEMIAFARAIEAAHGIGEQK